MKLKCKVTFPKEKNDLPLLKDVFSKGGFGKLAPGLTCSETVSSYLPVKEVLER